MRTLKLATFGVVVALIAIIVLFSSSAFGGTGANVPPTESLSLRAHSREVVAVPSDDAVGLSDGTEADPIWMPRGTFGLSYRF
ncbi:MAG TPA: hypothetical protein VEC56_06205 [Candidatus Krumholzibacteria bacterium]|nr:hypothetical protein [Candidatus Krumholzibacteria bacterium]